MKGSVTERYKRAAFIVGAFGAVAILGVPLLYWTAKHYRHGRQFLKIA
jgi:hypothetical protein